MRKIIYRISFIFAFLLLISASIFAIIPNIKLVAIDKNYETNEVCTGNYYDEDNTANINAFLRSYEDWSESYDGTVLPESYCLRDDYMIFSGNQNPQGLCWAFGASMALTTTIMKQTKEYLDFSENYISTARTYASQNDLMPSFYGSKNYLPGGGGWFLTFDYIAREYGLVLEQDYNFEIGFQNCVENSEEFYEYYSQFADKNLIDNYTTGKFNDYQIDDEEKSETIKNSMKQHLINHGGIALSMHWVHYQTFNVNNVLRTIKLPDTPTTSGGGHLVTLIGYDDNFEVTIDDVDYKGAWIGLNSWGNSFGNDGIVYILYDDTNIHSSGTNAISAYKYKQSTSDDLYMYNFIAGSNSSYETNRKGAYYGNFEGTNSTTNQKNIFYNNDIRMMYSYNISPNTSIDKVEVYRNTQNVTDMFTITFNKTANRINFKANDLELGAYKILFTYSNSIRSEQTFSCFYLLDGTEICSVYFDDQVANGGDIENNGIYQNFNSLNFQKEEIIYGTTKTSGSLYFRVDLATYHNITSVTTEMANTSLKLYTSGIILNRFYGYIYFSGKTTDYIIKLTNAYGKSRDLVIKVLYTSDGSDELTSVIYETNGGKNSINNSKKVLLKSTEDYAIDIPTKEGYAFKGWYYKKDFSETNKLKFSDGNYYLEYNKINIISNPTIGYTDYFSKSVAVFLYAKWERVTFTITASCGPNGTISPKGENILKINESQTFTFAPNEGYRVIQIIVDGISLNSNELQNAILNGYTFNNITKDHTIQVNFAKNDIFILTYNLNYTSSQDVLQTYLYDASINLLTNVTREGYSFLGWYNESSCTTEFSLTKMPDNNLTVYAKWERLSYQIIASSDENSTITPSEVVTLYYGDSQIYTFSAKTGYYITEIIIDNISLSSKALSNAITNGYEFTNVDCDHKIEVKSTINTYSIDASSGPNGTITPYGTTIKKYLESQTYIFTPNDGYNVASILVDNVKLQGANLNLAIKNGYTFNNINKDHTIIVYYTPKRYTITYNLNYEGCENIIVSANFGANITLLTNVTREGYTFLGWYNESSCTTKFSLTKMPANNITIYAKWSNLSYQIIALSDNNSMISPSDVVTVYYGDSQIYTFSAKTGYHITEIIIDNISLSSKELSNAIKNGYEFTNVDCDHTIEVKSTKNTYSIDASSGSNGTITPNGIIMKKYSESQTYTFTPYEGYYITTILVDNVKLQGTDLNLAIKNGYTFNNINANHAISVHFAPKQYNITYNLNYDGSENITELVLYGDNLNLITNVERIGYEFAGWYNDNNCENEFTLVKMPANDIMVYAKWNQVYYNIVYSLNYNDEILVTQTYKYNAKILLPFEPTREGYNFIGWYNDEESLSRFELKNMPNKNITIYASWQIKSYNVNIIYSQGGVVTPSGNFIKNYGEYINLNITANNGYHLSKVTFNGIKQELENFVNNYPLFVDGDIDIVIEFEKNVYKINYIIGNGGHISKDTLINKISHGESHLLKVELNFNKVIDMVSINGQLVEVENNTIQLNNIDTDLNIQINFKTQSFLLTPIGFAIIGVSAIFMSPAIFVFTKLATTLFSFFI